MAVMNDDFADFAEGVVAREVEGGAVAAVPGGFAIDQDRDLGALRGRLHCKSIAVAHGQWFLHHDGNAMTCALLHDTAMVKRIGVNEDSLGLGFLQHFVDACKEDVVRKRKLRFVEGCKFLVRLGDADDPQVGAMEILAKKSGDVAMYQAGDRDPQGCWVRAFSLLGLRTNARQRQQHGDSQSQHELSENNSRHEGLLTAEPSYHQASNRGG